MTHCYFKEASGRKCWSWLLGSAKKRISNGQQLDRQKESVSVEVLHTVKLLVQKCSLECTCVQWYCYVIVTVLPIQHTFRKATVPGPSNRNECMRSNNGSLILLTLIRRILSTILVDSIAPLSQHQLKEHSVVGAHNLLR